MICRVQKMRFWTLQIVLNMFFRNLKFHRKIFFFEFSAEISARGPKFLHLGCVHPFSALFSKIFEKFEKNRIFSIPSSCLDDAYLESCETLYFTKKRKKSQKMPPLSRKYHPVAQLASTFEVCRS